MNLLTIFASRTTKLIVILAVVLFTAGMANATLITFNNLVGSNMDPYLGHTQDGFVLNTIGDWHEAHIYGNPTPSIYGTSQVGTLEITNSDTGYFFFDGTELADALLGSGVYGTYAIKGYLDGSNVMALSGDLINSFFNVAGPGASQLLDKVEITLYKGWVSYNIDNIQLTTAQSPNIPEPATIGMITFGLLGAGYARRRRHS